MNGSKRVTQFPLSGRTKRMLRRYGGKTDRCACAANSTRGVVLLEAVVAIGILGMLVSAILSLTARSSSAMYSAADRLTATYLAYDAAEAIRARKMFNEGNVQPWLKDIDATDCGTVCGVTTIHDDVTLVKLDSLCAPQCPLYQNGATFRGAAHSGFVESYFRRTVSVTTHDLDSVPADVEEAKYTITVYWRTSGGREESVSIDMVLYKTNP